MVFNKTCLNTVNSHWQLSVYQIRLSVCFHADWTYFSYDKNARPHAVTEVENADGKIPGDALTTSFNDFGKIQLIEDAGKSLRMDFSYGPDQERWCSELSKNGTDVRTTVYAGEYEKITENGVTREFYYLDGNTIAIRENGTVKNYLAFTDNLGSILCVMDENGTKVFDASYDAWGRQTVTLNTIGLHRGYTGHEMLSEFDIINMNGRLYDPVLGRFFSPDNYVQMPDNSQNFNRYSYCLNNPLKYTDPSGEFFELIAFAAFNMASSMMQASFEGKSVWKAGALSLLSSAASYGIGEAFKNAAATFGNELLRAGAHGLASGVVSALDGGNFASAFVSGAAASGIGSYAKTIKGLETWQMVSSTAAMGGVVAWATGGDFLQGAMQGMTIGVLNHREHDPVNRGQLFHGKKARERAYKYMRKRSGKMGYELSAAYLENGDVLVFKEKGNTETRSHNYFVKKDGKLMVVVNGTTVVATGSVHTHPYVDGIKSLDNPLSISGADIQLSTFFDHTLDILVVKTGNGVQSGVYRVGTNGNSLQLPQLKHTF